MIIEFVLLFCNRALPPTFLKFYLMAHISFPEVSKSARSLRIWVNFSDWAVLSKHTGLPQIKSLTIWSNSRLKLKCLWMLSLCADWVDCSFFGFPLDRDSTLTSHAEFVIFSEKKKKKNQISLTQGQKYNASEITFINNYSWQALVHLSYTSCTAIWQLWIQMTNYAEL